MGQFFSIQINPFLLGGTSLALIAGTLLVFKRLISSQDLVTLVSPQIKYPLELIDKKILTHDTRRFRFALPTNEHRLGISLGHHIVLTARINGELIVRPYTPTSTIDEKGYFDLVIKVYKANENPSYPNGGKMSQYLDAMNIGDKIDVRGPTGRLVYKRNGLFELKFERTSPLTNKQTKHIGMIAGGTGITPMFQLIKDICMHPEDMTKMSLIFCNKTDNDILLQSELEEYKEMKPDQLKVCYTVSKTTLPDWKHETGRVCETMIVENLPAPSKDTIILMCGPSAMVKQTCVPILEKLGYTKEMMFIC